MTKRALCTGTPSGTYSTTVIILTVRSGPWYSWFTRDHHVVHAVENVPNITSESVGLRHRSDGCIFFDSDIGQEHQRARWRTSPVSPLACTGAHTDVSLRCPLLLLQHIGLSTNSDLQVKLVRPGGYCRSIQQWWHATLLPASTRHSGCCPITSVSTNTTAFLAITKGDLESGKEADLISTAGLLAKTLPAS